MNLIEEYLRAVGALLPTSTKGAQSSDIIAELRDLILSRIEEREAELGRRLNDEGVEAVLREIGHPITVAAGYGEGPQHAVGPTLYPYWAFAVKAAVALQIVVAAVVLAVRSAATGDVGSAVGQAIGSAITGSLVLVGVATLVCWTVERRLVRIDYAQRWRVRDLRPLQFARLDWRQPAWSMAGGNARGAVNGRRNADSWRRDRAAEGVCAIVGGSLVLLWWTGASSFTLPSPVEWRQLGVDTQTLATVDWTALREALLLPVAAWCLLLVGKGAVLVARPQALALRGLIDLAASALVLGAAGWLWFYSPLAQMIRIDNVAQLALSIKQASRQNGLIEPSPFLSLGVILLAFSGLVRLGRGLGSLILGVIRSEPVSVRAAPQAS